MNTLDRCRIGTSPAARRMDAAGMAFQRERDEAARQAQAAEPAPERAVSAPRFLRPSRQSPREWAEAQIARWAQLQPHIVIPRMKPAWQQIMEDVAKLYGVLVDDIVGDSRLQLHVVPRQEAMYRISEETALSLPEIGRKFGRDHTTVLHGIRTHAARHGLPIPRTGRASSDDQVAS